VIQDPESHEFRWTKKSCDFWGQITRVTGTLELHGQEVDRPL
jgi:hypothetical protein